MLDNNQIKTIEQIICYEFHNKQLLAKLFANQIPFDHNAYENGLNIFESFIHKESKKPIFDNLSYYNHLNDEQKIWYNRDLFESDETDNFYTSLEKIGLNKYLNFNRDTPRHNIYEFVFHLINAIDADCNSDWATLSKVINKITLYDYVLYYPGFEESKLDFQFAFNSYQCKHAILEINCPKFLTFAHQTVSETYPYLMYYFVDLNWKTAKDYPDLKDIWNNVNYDDDIVKQFESIAKEHHLNTGYLYLHDEYYWYCLAFASKYKDAFFAKSEKKEEAKKLAVVNFLKNCNKLSGSELSELEHDQQAVGLMFLFANMLHLKLDLPNFNEHLFDKLNLKNVPSNHLIRLFDRNNIYTLQVYQQFANQTNCLLFVKNLPTAFSATGSNQTDALINTCELLIKQYSRF